MRRISKTIFSVTTLAVWVNLIPGSLPLSELPLIKDHTFQFENKPSVKMVEFLQITNHGSKTEFRSPNNINRNDYTDYFPHERYPLVTLLRADNDDELHCLAKAGVFGFKALKLIVINGINTVVITKLLGYLFALLSLLPYLLFRPIVQVVQSPVATTTTTGLPTTVSSTTLTVPSSSTTLRPTTSMTTTSTTTTTTPFPEIVYTCPPCRSFKTNSCPNSVSHESLDNSYQTSFASSIDQDFCLERIICRFRIEYRGINSNRKRRIYTNKVSKLLRKLLLQHQSTGSQALGRIALNGIEDGDPAGTNCSSYTCGQFTMLENFMDNF